MRTPSPKKYVYDLSLDQGVSANLVSWVTGLMVFFITLALTINFSLAAVSKTWMGGLSGTLTVEVKPPPSAAEDGLLSGAEQKKFDASVQKVMSVLKDHTSVSSSRLLSAAEVKNLIQPWMGEGITLDSITLPALIDIRLLPNADVEELQATLKSAEPLAGIDRHTNTMDDVKSIVHTATLFVLLLTCVIFALAIVAVSGIVRSKMLIHHSEVEILHLIGASDEYIARQFRQHTLRGTLRGAVIGLTCTCITLVAIAAITHMLNESLIPYLQWTPQQWAMLFLAPLFAGSMIAHLTAQATVLKELSRMP